MLIWIRSFCRSILPQLTHTRKQLMEVITRCVCDSRWGDNINTGNHRSEFECMSMSCLPVLWLSQHSNCIDSELKLNYYNSTASRSAIILHSNILHAHRVIYCRRVDFVSQTNDLITASKMFWLFVNGFSMVSWFIPVRRPRVTEDRETIFSN